MPLPVSVASHKCLQKLEQNPQLLVCVTYVDQLCHSMANRQFGALINNTPDEVVLAVGPCHRPVFSWKDGQNKIMSIAVYEIANIADFLQHSHLTTNGSTYTKPPWET